MCITLRALETYLIPKHLHIRNNSFQCPLDFERVRHPLMMDTRLVNCRLHIHLEVDHVDDQLKDGVDNRTAAWTTGHEERLAVFEDNRRCHRAEHALSGLDKIRRRSDQTFCIGNAGIHVEIVHLVVE